MKKAFVIISVCLLLLVGCKSVETEYIYIPVYPDWAELPLIVEQKPNPVEGLVMPATMHDIVSNSLAFQNAYYNWKDYASLVEAYTLQLKEQYSP